MSQATYCLGTSHYLHYLDFHVWFCRWRGCKAEDCRPTLHFNVSVKPLDIFKLTEGLFLAVFFMRRRVRSPDVFVATKTGILSQNVILSKPDQSIGMALRENWKLNLKQRKAATYLWFCRNIQYLFWWVCWSEMTCSVTFSCSVGQ